MNAITAGGSTAMLTDKEAKIALAAVASYRRSLARSTGAKRKVPIREERDRECHALRSYGYTDAEIGRMVGISARAVRSAVARVDEGRYGR